MGVHLGYQQQAHTRIPAAAGGASGEEEQWSEGAWDPPRGTDQWGGGPPLLVYYTAPPTSPTFPTPGTEDQGTVYRYML